jgi:hypothetical protein
VKESEMLAEIRFLMPKEEESVEKKEENPMIIRGRNARLPKETNAATLAWL